MNASSNTSSGHRSGVRTRYDPDAGTAESAPRPGGAGTIGWPGAYGSWWQADPNDGSALIFLSRNMVELQQMARGIGLGVWDAIGRFHAAATS